MKYQLSVQGSMWFIVIIYLSQLGVRQAFEDTASFPGIARGQSLQQRLRISKVLQRSGIEVNELGSVAYSAIGIFSSSVYKFMLLYTYISLDDSTRHDTSLFIYIIKRGILVCLCRVSWKRL